MLTIKDDDFSDEIGSRSGVTFWLEKIPGIKNLALAVAWPDLVVLRPNLSLPGSVKHISSRKFIRENQSVHIFWTEKTHRYAHITTVEVPDISQIHSVDMDSIIASSIDGATPKRTPKWLLIGDLAISAKAVKRALMALDIDPPDMELKKVDIDSGTVFVVMDEDSVGAIIGCIKSAELDK